MAQLTETITKKRKHAIHTALDPETSSPSKKSKKDNKSKSGSSKKKDKGKGKSKSSGSEFRLVNASLVVSIPPVFASNPRAGVEEMLDSMVMRYNILRAFRSKYIDLI
jgi:DNA-directed RNA polymerase I subunit RPA43